MADATTINNSIATLEPWKEFGALTPSIQYVSFEDINYIIDQRSNTLKSPHQPLLKFCTQSTAEGNILAQIDKEVAATK